MGQCGILSFVLYLLVVEVICAPVEEGIGASAGQKESTGDHMPTAGLDAELKSQGTGPAKQSMISGEESPQFSDSDKEKLEETFSDLIVDEINVENILQNALNTLQRHPEILKDLIETEEKKENSDDNSDLDQQLLNQQFHDSSQEKQKKSKDSDIPFQEFKEFPVDVSDTNAIIQYANEDKGAKRDDQAEKQAMSFDLSMLPMEGGIDDPLFLDTSQQSMDAQKLIKSLQEEENKIKHNEPATNRQTNEKTKKNIEPRQIDDTSLLNDKMMKDLQHDLDLLTQQEKDELFSFMPQQFKADAKSRQENIQNSKKDQEEVTDQFRNEAPQLSDNGENVRMHTENNHDVPGEYVAPNQDFLVDISDADFLEKLRTMEKNAKGKLKFHDLEFPSDMFNGFRGNGKSVPAETMEEQSQNNSQKRDKEKIEGAPKPPVLSKRSNEDDLKALAGMKV